MCLYIFAYLQKVKIVKSLFFASLLFGVILLGSCKENSCNCSDNKSRDTVIIKYDQFWDLLDYSFETIVNTILVTKSNYIIAATTNKGILISKDRWKSWNKSPGVPDSNITKVKQISDGRIAVILGKKLYISNDEGQSWTEIIFNYPENFDFSVNRLDISTNGTLGFRGKNNPDTTFNYYVSSDMGANWDAIPFRLLKYYTVWFEANDKCRFVAFSDNDITKCYIKKTGESSYNEVMTKPGRFDLKIWYFSDYIFLRATYLYRSIDFGKTWELTENGIYHQFGYDFYFFTYSYKQDVLILSYANGIYYSPNNADNWKYLINESPQNSYYLTNDNHLIKNYVSAWFISRKPIF